MGDPVCDDGNERFCWAFLFILLRKYLVLDGFAVEMEIYHSES